MVYHEFHHPETLTQVSINLKVHENCANKATAHYIDVFRNRDRESFFRDDCCDEEDHKGLDTKDENGGVVCAKNIFLAEAQLAHHLKAECLKSHGIGVVA